MKKYLKIRFNLEQVIVALCEQTLLLGIGALLFCKIWEWIFSLNTYATICSWLTEGSCCFSFLSCVSVLLVLLFFLYINEIEANKYRMAEVFSPVKGRGYPFSYKFNWQAIIFYALCMGFMACVYSWWLIPGYIVLVDIVSLYVLCGMWDKFNEKEAGNSQHEGGLLQDTPIFTLEQDSLGRQEFVKTLYNIINNSKGNSNIILLNGAWGLGKTSVLNCLENYAVSQDENELIFKWINPWQNDTKERFVNALLEEINLFLQYTYPKDIIPRSLFKRLSVSVCPAPFISFSFSSPSETSNIGVNIQELSAKLKPKQNQLVIIVDDLDRLDKRQVLDILAIVYLFSECHNIIFILAANQVKVESLLTEEQVYHEDNERHRCFKAYQGYLEKIATNIVPLPEILPSFLKENLIQQIASLNWGESSFNWKEAQSYIPVSLFHNLRDVKRVLLAFFNVMQQPTVQGEVNPYHMLLVSFLYVFTPKVYTEIGQTPSYWILEYIKDKTQNLQENYSELQRYFEDLLSFYPDKRKELETIFLLLNPEYYHVKTWDPGTSKVTFNMSAEMFNMYSFSSKVVKPFYNEEYFDRYFTYRPNIDTLPDKIMGSHVEKLRTLSGKEGAIEAGRFLHTISDTQMLRYFNYLRQNFPFGENRRLYELVASGLVILLNDGDTEPGKKKTLIYEVVRRWIRQSEVSSEIIKYVFDNVTSILFKTAIYYMSEIKPELCKQLQFPPVSSYTAEDILKEEEKYVEFQYALTLIYFWMGGWKNSTSYNEARKEEAVCLFEKNFHYFWFAVGKSLYDDIDSHMPIALQSTMKTWGVSTLKRIISSWLKNSNIEYKEELLRLQQFLASQQSGKNTNAKTV